MNTKERIAKLDSILKDLNAPVLEYLNPGLKRSEIEEFFEKNGIYPNSALIDLLEWHNGTSFPYESYDGECSITPFCSLHSLSDIISRRKTLLDWIQDFDLEDIVPLTNHIPFMGSGEGAALYLVSNDDLGLVYYHHIKDQPMLEFESIDQMLDFIIECYEKKAFFIDPKYGLDIDSHLYDELTGQADA